MENNTLGTWKFSCEATRKEAEELAKAFLDFDGNSGCGNPLLETLFKKLPEPTVTTSLEEDIFVTQSFECDAWINIDELNINADIVNTNNEDINESTSSPMSIIEENVCIHSEAETVPETKVIISSDYKQQISEFQISLQQSGGSSLSREVSEKLGALSETHLTSLLVSLRHSATDTALVSLCLSICENMGLREQSVVASLLCSQTLLVKAREADLEGPLLAATCQLAMTLPHVVASRLLLPLLMSGSEGQARACHLVGMCDNEDLRHALLRSWLEDIGSQQAMTESDLELVRLLLKTPAKDPDTIRRVCRMFGHAGATLASNTNFSKLLLLTIKALTRGSSLPDESKQQLNAAVAANKTTLKKILEKAMSSI